MNQEFEEDFKERRSKPVIGVFDSGVGGLSVLRAIRKAIPDLPVIYLADQAHVPYGQRPLEQVKAYALEISRYLIQQGAGLIVVACNTASAAALYTLRQAYSEIPFVGMEPAVKPAAEFTRSGKVGVLATPATFQGELYASVVERFASSVDLYQSTCPGLVEQIEAGYLDTPTTRSILEGALLPMLDNGIDTVVLGCTHYPFVIPLIEEIAGPQVRVIDPAPAIARQVQRLLSEPHQIGHTSHPYDQPEQGNPTLQLTRFHTTGDPADFQHSIKALLGVESQVLALKWVRDTFLTAFNR